MDPLVSYLGPSFGTTDSSIQTAKCQMEYRGPNKNQWKQWLPLRDIVPVGGEGKGWEGGGGVSACYRSFPDSSSWSICGREAYDMASAILCPFTAVVSNRSRKGWKALFYGFGSHTSLCVYSCHSHDVVIPNKIWLGKRYCKNKDEWHSYWPSSDIPHA
ncbi:hypothetical protein LOAG_02051 [Loa loa]|uniref:Uncharacterized protein n=1 Tax=Loa loa TaxID=7209 RepID=A0A1S0U9I2_LOALO|nr:hypothetical protein LOAG_02051 [Loa loa]EFO26434.1 hypothetical protein LOAG_02051 [Loa loa]